jgi:C4-dicarboxylate transporter/malic acid transport protein
MVTTFVGPPAPEAMADRSTGRLGRFRDLDRPRPGLSYLTPNWFASVMGTGIVAVAAHGLPWTPPGLATVAAAFWALATVLLVVLSAATAVHWVRYPSVARGHVLDPVMSHFYGAPPMAMMTVGAGTLLVGHRLLGDGLALSLDWVLWGAGTAAGLSAAAIVPYLMFVRHGLRADQVFGGWLMPIVPPMVSASTGALLVPYASPGVGRTGLLLACYAMFSAALIASVFIISRIVGRLARHDVGEPRLVPTLWIVLGPLGQSITAANLLGGVAHLVLPANYAHALVVLGLGYGAVVLIGALAYAALATAVTVRVARDHLPFSLTWWSFTFPVGTVVTGTSGLARHTDAGLLRAAAVVLFGGLLAAWTTVAVRTVRGAVRGELLRKLPEGLVTKVKQGVNT